MNHQRVNTKSYSNQNNDDDWDEVHRQMLHVQKKSMEISNPGDPDEEEADTVARKVMNGESASISGTSGGVNRKGEGSVEAGPEFQSQLQNSKGSGQSLPASLQQEMGSKMGADFSDVKIHNGGESSAMNNDINAKAFTSGNHIYFNEGQYNPQSRQGKELIAHELVHTQQQKNNQSSAPIQRQSQEEFDVYVEYKIELYNRELKKLQDAKDIEGAEKLTAEHNKFLKDVKGFRKKMDKKEGAGWKSPKYGKKLHDKFGDYDQRIGDKKTEVHGEIAATVGLLNANLESVTTLIKLAISTVAINKAGALPILRRAKESLENAKAGRVAADSFLSGAEETRLLNDYDDILNRYGTLIKDIEKQIEGYDDDTVMFEGILIDLDEQKKKLTEFNLLAAGENDVVTLIKMQKDQLSALKTSIEQSITKANNATPATKAIQDTDMPGRLTTLEQRSDANLQDNAVTKEVNQLTKTATYPRVPVIAQLVHNQLISTTTDKQIVLVNLQKLSSQQEINAFKTFYKNHYGTEIKDDLTLRLTGLDLQLALEFLKMGGEVKIIEAKPTNDAQRTALADRIHTALYKVPAEVQTVFACLIPFNRNKAAIDLLKTKYSSRHGVELEADIKAKIGDDNDESYAIYLLNAPASDTEAIDLTFDNAGTVADQKNVLGGKVTATGGLNLGTYENGFSLDYTGVMAPDMHWLQFLWWECLYWTSVDPLSGLGIGPGIAIPKNGNAVSSLDGPIDLTTNHASKNYIVDTPSTEHPFYEKGPTPQTSWTHDRGPKNTMMFDRPGFLQLNLGGNPLGANRMHFTTYLVRDFLPILEATVVVEHLQTPTSVPTKPTSVTMSTKAVTALDPLCKARLDSKYPKYSYIR